MTGEPTGQACNIPWAGSRPLGAGGRLRPMPAGPDSIWSRSAAKTASLKAEATASGVSALCAARTPSRDCTRTAVWPGRAATVRRPLRNRLSWGEAGERRVHQSVPSASREISGREDAVAEKCTTCWPSWTATPSYAPRDPVSWATIMLTSSASGFEPEKGGEPVGDPGCLCHEASSASSGVTRQKLTPDRDESDGRAKEKNVDPEHAPKESPRGDGDAEIVHDRRAAAPEQSAGSAWYGASSTRALVDEDLEWSGWV